MGLLSRTRYICDFETYSELDVREVGAWAYAEHPSTEILCMSWGRPGQKKKIWVPSRDEFPTELISHIEQGGPIEAHNVQFERAIWKHVLNPKFSVPLPRTWLDTLAVCAYHGLPQGLGDVGPVLGLPIVKDKRGKYLLQKLSKPQRPTKKNPETRCNDPALLEELYQYCMQDGEAEDALGETLGDLPIEELKVWILDQRINHRGVSVDLEAVDAAIRIVDTLTTRLVDELRALTMDEFGVPMVKSGSEIAKIIEWCKLQGASVPNLQAGTVEDLLKARIFPDNVNRVLEIRQQLSRASAKKLLKFRDCANKDRRIRGLLQYHGAGTGRWAGRLVQPQNFPRGGMAIEHKKTTKWNGDQEMEALIESIKTGDPDLLDLQFGNPMEAISTSLRGMFVASPGKKLFVADFSAIEARVVMWLAGQIDALEAFRLFDAGKGPDIYCSMASKIYDRPISKEDKEERGQGKITVLGCGYQMSGPKLQMQAEAMGVTISLDRANELVAIFRNVYAEVPKLWRGLEDCAISAIRLKGKSIFKNPNGIIITFRYETNKAGNWLSMELPNGRKLWYFNPGLELRTIQYADKITGEIKEFTKDSIFYEGRDNKKGGAWGIVYSYGGMLTENAVQAIARDLMVAAMFRVEDAGFFIVLSVHDELVAEGDPARDFKEFEHLVSGPNPSWAKDCPVAAEGWSGTRYRK